MTTSSALPNLEALRQVFIEQGCNSLAALLGDRGNDIDQQIAHIISSSGAGCSAVVDLLRRLEAGVQDASTAYDARVKEVEDLKKVAEKYEGWDAQWDELQNQLNRLQHTVEAKDMVIASLQTALNHGGGTDSKRDAVLKDPSTFTGEGTDSRTVQATFTHWATCIKLRWAQNPTKFATETTKLTHIVGLLSGDAWTSQSNVAQNILSESGTQFATGADFLSHLEHIYAPHDLSQDAKTELLGLAQGELPFATFLSKFNALADRAQWSNAQKIDGLKTRVSSQVQTMHRNNVDDPPHGDWNAWVTRFMKYAAKIEENKALQEHQKAFRGAGKKPGHIDTHFQNHNHASAANSRNTHTNSSADPMDLDSLMIARLDPVERQRRIDNDLCKRCGQGGHYARNCDGAGNIVPDRYPRPNNPSGGMRGGRGGRGRGRGGNRGGYENANNYNATSSRQWQPYLSQYQNPYQSRQDVQLRAAQVTPPQGQAGSPNQQNQQNQHQQGFVYGLVEELPPAQQQEFGYDSRNQGNGNAY